MSTRITLHAAAARALREAVLWQVGVSNEALTSAIEHDGNPRQIKTAYRRLVATGDVLDEIGWSARSRTVTLDLARHAWAVRGALRSLVADHRLMVAAAVTDADQHARRRAEARIAEAQQLQRTVEAAIKDAKVEVRDPARATP